MTVKATAHSEPRDALQHQLSAVGSRILLDDADNKQKVSPPFECCGHRLMVLSHNLSNPGTQHMPLTSMSSAPAQRVLLAFSRQAASAASTESQTAKCRCAHRLST